ncbi:M48 family metalloprotease [Halobaculum sp. MBLA0147]|uniref:M48 family metalloprotease n=1 Tax=Halobaculum sp. MBLA0147 TaxID=3079934 RepID=UPI00352453E3
MVSRTRRRSLRVAATLGAALAATGLVAVGLAALLAPWFGALLPSGSLGVAALTLGLAAVLVVVQLGYVRSELLATVDATVVDRETYPDLHARLTRVAGLADAPVPDVAVVDSPVPNSCSVAGATGGTVVVSTGLLEELDDEELDAVLAHELAHLRNRDAVVLTLASFLPALVAGSYTPVASSRLDDLPATAQWTLGGLGLAVAYGLAVPSLPGGPLSLASLSTFVVGAVAVAVFGGVALGAAATLTVYLARSLAREREFGADRAAARLTGSPATLADVLERLADAGAPARDGRETAQTGPGGATEGHVAELCLLPHGFDAPSEDGPATREAGTVAERPTGPVRTTGDLLSSFALETRAHPPVERRLAALRALTDERARARGVETEA